MRLNAPPLVQHDRLTRMLSWVGLWLGWLGAALNLCAQVLPRHAERALGAMLNPWAHLLAQIVFLRALARLGPRGFARKHHAHFANARGVSFRAACGARLRRALRGQDFQRKLAALTRFIRDAEIHVSKLARRLARGLTRRAKFACAATTIVDALTAPALYERRADSS
jgi:hypothetical protein